MCLLPEKIFNFELTTYYYFVLIQAHRLKIHESPVRGTTKKNKMLAPISWGYFLPSEICAQIVFIVI